MCVKIYRCTVFLGGVGVPVEGARRLSLLLSISSFNALHPALASVIQ